MQANGLFLTGAAASSCCIAYLLVFGSGGASNHLSPQQTEIIKQAFVRVDEGVAVAPKGWRAYSQAASANKSTSPTTVVVDLPRTTRSPTAEPAAIVASPTMPTDRASLTRELQRQLGRVGCYTGDVNGIWTPATRRAIQVFTERVNATLPSSEPDQIMLALLQNHKGAACGTCPAGQTSAADNRCVPNAIFAKGTAPRVVAGRQDAGGPAREASPAITGWSTTTSTAPTYQAPPAEGRMALAGPDAANPSTPGPEQPATAAAVPPPVPAKTAPPRPAPQKFGASIFRQLDRIGAN